MDISGPHCAGRWPSDSPESWSKRAAHFIVGAYKTFNEEEVNGTAKHQLDAADHSNSVVTEPPLTHVEGESMLYFARPLENKETESTVAAIQDMINEINCRYKTKAVFRLHSDRAQ